MIIKFITTLATATKVAKKQWTTTQIKRRLLPSRNRIFGIFVQIHYEITIIEIIEIPEIRWFRIRVHHFRLVFWTQHPIFNTIHLEYCLCSQSADRIDYMFMPCNKTQVISEACFAPWLLVRSHYSRYKTDSLFMYSHLNAFSFTYWIFKTDQCPFHLY